MGALDQLLQGFAVAADPMILLYALIGVTLGTAVGVLPGIGPALTVALLLPVTYGLDRRSYDFSEEERRDESNRYNTFANPGLPVGPIGSPGDAAIAAAADPQDNDYYFWVTVDLDTGETKFARTFAEHQVNVAEFQAYCRDESESC